MGIPKKFVKKLIGLRMTLTDYLKMLNECGVLSNKELNVWLLKPPAAGFDRYITQRISSDKN